MSGFMLFLKKKKKKECVSKKDFVMITILKNENFGNLLSEYFNKATVSDLVLHIGDTHDTKKVPLLIHTHLMCLHPASEFIRRYLSCFGNDPERCHVSGQNPLVPNQLNLTINLDYGNGRLNDEVVTLFFSLFYVNRFNEAHLKHNHIEEAFYHNILILYELALYFLFDTLIVYIESYFKATMSLAYFNHLSNFCLQPHPLTGAYVLDKKQRGATLYRRLVQWYTTCVGGDHVSPSPPPSIEEQKCDWHYFTRNKQAILGDIALIENCRLPKKEARRLADSSLSLDYHRTICETCMDGSKGENVVGSFYYLDMGCLTLGDYSFFLRLKKKKRIDPRGIAYDNKLELTMTHTTQQRYACKSRISLLSRKSHKDKFLQTQSMKSLFIPTEINNFDAHPVKHCYEGHCDHCTMLKPVYVILMRISLSREDEDYPHPLEDMTMNVEEPSVQ